MHLGKVFDFTNKIPRKYTETENLKRRMNSFAASQTIMVPWLLWYPWICIDRLPDRRPLPPYCFIALRAWHRARSALRFKVPQCIVGKFRKDPITWDKKSGKYLKPFRIFKFSKFKISHLFLLRVPGFSEITDNYASGSGFFDFFSEIGLGFVHIGLGKPGADFCHRV